MRTHDRRRASSLVLEKFRSAAPAMARRRRAAAAAGAVARLRTHSSFRRVPRAIGDRKRKAAAVWLWRRFRRRAHSIAAAAKKLGYALPKLRKLRLRRARAKLERVCSGRALLAKLLFAATSFHERKRFVRHRAVRRPPARHPHARPDQTSRPHNEPHNEDRASRPPNEDRASRPHSEAPLVVDALPLTRAHAPLRATFHSQLQRTAVSLWRLECTYRLALAAKRSAAAAHFAALRRARARRSVREGLERWGKETARRMALQRSLRHKVSQMSELRRRVERAQNPPKAGKGYTEDIQKLLALGVAAWSKWPS